MGRVGRFLVSLVLVAAAAGAQPAVIRPTITHATSCPSATAKAGVFCQELDANTVYYCEPTAGDCDTGAEWIGPLVVLTDSASLRTALSDETGTGAAMFGLTTAAADDLGCTGSQVVRRNAGDTAFECVTLSTIGGSTGATDNAVIRADGVGGATVQSSSATVDDNGRTTVATGTLSGFCWGDADTCLYEDSDDTLRLAFPTAIAWYLDATLIGDQLGNGPRMVRAPTATQADFSFRADDNAGLKRSGADDVRLFAGGASSLGVTTTEVDLYFIRDDAEQAVTCTDNGTPASAGTLTITPTQGFITVTNSDPDGCDVTMSETGAVIGRTVEIVVISNAGVTVNFADTAGVTELALAFVAGLYDSITLRYISDRWIETTRSDN